jgi:undecaprenyl-diphosphatase
MDSLQAIIFGIVQGVSEFLPISSTGHLILTSRLLELAQTEFLKSFEIIIQLGSILSVIALYWRKLFTDWETIKKIAVAFIPTGILGLIFYKIVKQSLLGNNAVVLWSLFLGGVLLIIFELWPGKKKEIGEKITEISYGQSFLIGVAQSVAIIPGVSRSAATILGGLMLGIERKTIVEFSFLLAVPTMLAATGLDLIKSADQFSLSQWNFLAVGFIVSFIVALASIKFLVNFIKKHSFIPFGIYRIAVSLAFWLLILN